MTPRQSKDCLFCKIVEGSIPAKKVAEDDRFICIPDIRPQAKVHLLVMPKDHVASLETAFPASGHQEKDLVGEMFSFAARVARESGLLPAGFRSMINTNAAGGQTVFHLHLHLLGGEILEEF